LFSSFRRRPVEPSIDISYSPSANEEINTYDLIDRLKVVDAIILLQHHRYREEKKSKLNLEVNGLEVWALGSSKLTVFFHTEKNGNIYVHWVALRTKFQAG
jgi:hypothetical protein